MMFLELVIQMAANTVDPTWKTAWFLPGPLTPVGIIAKLMAKEPDDNGDKKSEEEECKPKPPTDPNSPENKMDDDDDSATYIPKEPPVATPEVDEAWNAGAGDTPQTEDEMGQYEKAKEECDESGGTWIGGLDGYCKQE